MNIHALTVFGVILISIGTIFTFLGQQIINNRSSQLLNEKSENIEKLSQENIRLSMEIAQLNKKITATLTGGDNYCYFLPSRPGEKSNIVDLILINKGSYPLYDISVKIDDVEEMVISSFSS